MEGNSCGDSWQNWPELLDLEMRLNLSEAWQFLLQWSKTGGALMACLGCAYLLVACRQRTGGGPLKSQTTGWPGLGPRHRVEGHYCYIIAISSCSSS